MGAPVYLDAAGVLGGGVYSNASPAEVWGNVGLGKPIVYMVNAFRYGVLGVSDVNVYASLGVILAFVIAFYLFALWLLHRGTGIRH